MVYKKKKGKDACKKQKGYANLFKDIGWNRKNLIE